MNNTIEKMRNEVAVLVEKITDIRESAKAAGRELSLDERAALEEAKTRIDDLGEKIDLEISLDASLDNVRKSTNKPVRPDVKMEKKSIKSGIEVGINRRSKEEFNTLGEQLRAVITAHGMQGFRDPRLTTRAATGMNEGSGADGGFLVQTDFTSKILGPVWENNQLLNRVNRMSLTSNANSMSIPALDETSRVDGSRAGGIKGYWVGEADEKTATKPKLRNIDLKLNKLIGLVYLTDELMQDVGALESWVTTKFQEEFNFLLQDAIINGVGGAQPLGIVNSGAIVSQAAEGGQVANTVVYQNIVNMWSRLKADSRQNAIWIINQDVEPQLLTMSLPVGTGGAPVYLPNGGASVSPFRTLMGRPVIPVEQCQTLGTAGDIILCDWSKYLAIDKGGVQKDMSIHVRFVYDESVLRFVYRFDGQPELNSAITPFNGTNTLSHFVQLATRP